MPRKRTKQSSGASVRLPWAWDILQFEETLNFVEDRAYKIYLQQLNVPRAEGYFLSATGNEIDALPTAPDRSGGWKTRCRAYALPEALSRAGAKLSREVQVAGDFLFLTGIIRAAVKRGDAVETSQAMSRLFVNLAFEGWTADFSQKVRDLYEGNERRTDGGAKGGRKRASEFAPRDALLRRVIQNQIDNGRTYAQAIQHLLTKGNWPKEAGEPISIGTLRNKFQKKTFTVPSHP